MSGSVITETTIREFLKTGGRTFEVPRGSIITPLARDIAESHGVKLVEKSLVHTSVAADTPLQKPADARIHGPVAFGSDHGGFQLKEALKKHAETLGYAVLDLGTHSEDPCDYPDYAYAVARAVASGQAWRGVMVDGAGIGSCVVANKVPGIRAACCHNEFVARNAREHNDTNVLTLGSRVTGSEVCKEILRIWLEAWFSGGRHKGRVDKISDLERTLSK